LIKSYEEVYSEYQKLSKFLQDGKTLTNFHVVQFLNNCGIKKFNAKYDYKNIFINIDILCSELGYDFNNDCKLIEECFKNLLTCGVGIKINPVGAL